MTSPVTLPADDELTVTIERAAIVDADQRRVAIVALLAAFKMRYGYEPMTITLTATGITRPGKEP